MNTFASTSSVRAHALGVRVGPEVGAAGPVALAREVHAREVLVERDRDERIGLVVAQADVEARPVLLDEALLGQQRLGLAGDHHALDALDRSRPSRRGRGCSATCALAKCEATRLRIDLALPT